MRCTLIVLASIAAAAGVMTAIAAASFALGYSAQFIALHLGIPDLWSVVLLGEFAVVGGLFIGVSICRGI